MIYDNDIWWIDISLVDQSEGSIPSCLLIGQFENYNYVDFVLAKFHYFGLPSCCICNQ